MCQKSKIEIERERDEARAEMRLEWELNREVERQKAAALDKIAGSLVELVENTNAIFQSMQPIHDRLLALDQNLGANLAAMYKPKGGIY